MRCPACGFETPDSQAWCDFCKEPLRKKGAATAPPVLPAALDDGEKIPVLPAYVRWLAWGFLGVLSLSFLLAALLLMRRSGQLP